MRVLVCGDRHWSDKQTLFARLRQLPPSTVIIEGKAPGADSMAGLFAKSFGYPLVEVGANWDYYNKAAGSIRNRWMLDLQPDLVIAFHNDIEHSRGTKDCKAEAERRGITTELVTSATLGT